MGPELEPDKELPESEGVQEDFVEWHPRSQYGIRATFDKQRNVKFEVVTRNVLSGGFGTTAKSTGFSRDLKYSGKHVHYKGHDASIKTPDKVPLSICRDKLVTNVRAFLRRSVRQPQKPDIGEHLEELLDGISSDDDSAKEHTLDSSSHDEDSAREHTSEDGSSDEVDSVISSPSADIQSDDDTAVLTGQIRLPVEEEQLIRKRAEKAIRKETDPQIIEALKEQMDQSLNLLRETTAQAAKYGNKTANLRNLVHLFCDEKDVVIPPYQKISHLEVLDFIESNFPDFNILWEKLRDHFSRGGSVALAGPIILEIQTGIKRAFSSSSTFPRCAIIDAFAKPGVRLMVRSTGHEDTLKVRNPGGNDSVSNVQTSREAVCEAIGTVVASYFSEKSFGQRLACHHDLTQPPFMPVLLQEMVGETEGNIPTSGVMYTSESSLGTDGVMETSAGFGHADGIVTGSIPSDIFYVEGDYVHGIVREKPTRRAPHENGDLTTVNNPSHLKRVSSLTKKQLKRLAEIGRRAEKAYGYPLDIEWTYDPKTAIFYLLQARPASLNDSTPPSYISPEKIKDLKDIQQVTVVEAGGGRVRELNQGNTLVGQTAKEAVDMFLDNLSSVPEAVLIAEPSAPNSHEAGFFRERGIPVIYLPGASYKGIVGALKSKTVVLDVQEGIAVALPEGTNGVDFIVEGLRRHLAPKMESACFQTDSEAETFTAFLKDLKAQAGFFNLDNLKLAFGRNLLDKLLNSFEEAGTMEERAYLLSCLIQIVDEKLLIKLPEHERGELRHKILYDAQHVWSLYNTPNAEDDARKFAMNWLRSAILCRPVEQVMGSDTLYTALDSVKERKELNIPSLVSVGGVGQRTAYSDIFQRSVKFILVPQTRENWMIFINQLDVKELEALAVIFRHLGPQVVETWINSDFSEAWERHSGQTDVKMRASGCLEMLQERTETHQMKKTLEIQGKWRLAARQMSSLPAAFADPKQFDALLARLDKDFMPIVEECLRMMREAQGLEVAILSQAFLSMISAVDDCIKGMSESPRYQDNVRLKADRFALMLDRYLNMCCVALNDEILTDPVLLRQGEALSSFLPKKWERLKENMRDNPSKFLMPSKMFSVGMSALGSGLMAPERAPPSTFVDFFALVHQSLITATRSFGMRSGIQLSDLPEPLVNLSELFSRLDLQNRFKPTVQSISYNYPDVCISFNAPLNYHSAQFVIEAKVDAKGNLIAAEFHGKFSVPMSGVGLMGRDDVLKLMSLESYYCGEASMKAPDLYDFSMPGDGLVQFKWKIPLDGQNFENFKDHSMMHLQKMIDYLQKPEEVVYQLNPNPRILEDHPTSIKHFMSEWERLKGDQRTVIANSALKGSLENWNKKNVSEVLSHQNQILKNGNPDQQLVGEFVDRLLDDDSIWSDSRQLRHLLNFLSNLHGKSYQSEDPYCYVDEALRDQAARLQIFVGEECERVRKIQKRIQALPEAIPIIDPYDRLYRKSRNDFVRVFS